jgi:excisionase family DNA binding protein
MTKRIEALADGATCWMTADETVQYLALPSRRALYQLVRRGSIPAHRLGRKRYRFDRDELDRTVAGDRSSRTSRRRRTVAYSATEGVCV